MKKLARIILTVLATQLLAAGFVYAAHTQSTSTKKGAVQVMPEDDPGPTETF